jgi:stearoyl-CoA desaturase (delta-9 desaturase)
MWVSDALRNQGNCMTSATNSSASAIVDALIDAVGDARADDPNEKLGIDPDAKELDTVSWAYQIATLLMVIIPPIALVVAIALLWHVAIGPVHLILFGVLYVATGLGITIGYHRLFTHKSFEAPRPIRFLLAVFGTMAAEGPVITWVATHRKHHILSDREGDPHSPHDHDGTVKEAILGFIHAHCVWFIKGRTKPDVDRYAPDLAADPMLRFVDRTAIFWIALGLVMPAVIAGLVTWSWMGALLGLLWGGFVRVLFVHHVTWSINSVCHIWGSRGYDCADHSKNNVLFGILAFGEGWHNNHHAFPASARHGLKWWQFDISYITIRLMSLVGLASQIRTPSKERMKAKEIKRKAGRDADATDSAA